MSNFFNKVYNPFEEISAENELYYGETITVKSLPLRFLFTLGFYGFILYRFISAHVPIIWTSVFTIVYLLWCFIGFKVKEVDYDDSGKGLIGGVIDNPITCTNEIERVKQTSNALVMAGNFFTISWLLLFDLVFRRKNFKDSVDTLESEFEIRV